MEFLSNTKVMCNITEEQLLKFKQAFMDINFLNCQKNLLIETSGKTFSATEFSRFDKLLIAGVIDDGVHQQITSMMGGYGIQKHNRKAIKISDLTDLEFGCFQYEGPIESFDWFKSIFLMYGYNLL